MTVTADGPPPSVSGLRLSYEAGASVRAISRATGIPFKTVHRRLQEAGTPFRKPGGRPAAPPPRTLSPAEIAAAAAAYERDRLSLDELGARYGRSGGSMGRLLRRAGVDVRPRGRTPAAPPPPLPTGLRELHSQGLRPADIAARTPGTTAAGIARALHGAGLAPHRGRPLPPAQRLAADYARAGSVRALARQLHADEDRLRGALAAAGVPSGSLRRIPVQLRHQVAKLAALGAPPAEIARRTGLPSAATARLGRPAERVSGHGSAALFPRVTRLPSRITARSCIIGVYCPSSFTCLTGAELQQSGSAGGS
jgi:transposase-like protein